MNRIKACERCGEVFERHDSYSNKQWASRRFCSRICGAISRTKDKDAEIIDLYCNQKKGSQEIADEVGFSSVHVLRVLKKNGVKTRPHSENKKLSHARKEVREKISLAQRGKPLAESAKEKLRLLTGDQNKNWTGGLTITSGGYIQFTSSPANGENAGKLLHVVVAEWLYQRKVKPGEHVHHIDGNKLNNDPENLTIMSGHDHAKIHKLGEVGNG